MGDNRKRKTTGSTSVRTIFRILVILMLYSTTPNPPVDADELMWRAMKAERAPHATVVERVNVRFTPHRGGDRVSFAYEPGSKAAGAGAPAGIPPAIAEKLRAAGFDWSNPLGLQLPNAFRVSHVLDKSERVVRRASAGLYVLAMSAPESAGELSEIEVTVNDEAFHVVHLAVVFRDIGRLEIGELTRRAAGYVPPRKPAPIVSIPAPRPSRDELDLAELKVRLLFGQTGVDIRGGIRISRAADAVRVEGRPTPADQLNAIKYVQVQPDASVAATAPRVPAAARSGLVRWRERNFAGTSEYESFLRNLTRSLATVQQRLAIVSELSDLSERYAAPRSDMSPAARKAFEQLRDLQYQQLRAELNESRAWMLTFAGAVPVAYESASTPTDFVARAPAALARAQDLQRLVLDDLTQDDLTADDQQQVNAAFAALWEAVHGARLTAPHLQH